MSTETNVSDSDIGARSSSSDCQRRTLVYSPHRCAVCGDVTRSVSSSSDPVVVSRHLEATPKDLSERVRQTDATAEKGETLPAEHENGTRRGRATTNDATGREVVENGNAV